MLAKVQPTANKMLLTPAEKEISSAMINLKLREINRLANNTTFYSYKRTMEKSRLFHLMKRMPKGASLDGHLFGLISQEYLYNLTFSSDLCIRIKNNMMRFSYRCTNSTNWLDLTALRRGGVISETLIKDSLSFQPDDLHGFTSYTQKLSNVFNTVKTLLSKRSVLEASIYQMLKEFYQDNVIYVEFRYSLDYFDSKIGRKYEPHETLKICHQVIQRFKRFHSTFFDAKIIYSPQSRKNFDENFGTVVKLTALYPQLLIGFDVRSDKEISIALNRIDEIPISTQLFLFFDENVDFQPNTNLNLIQSAVNRPSRYMYTNNLLRNKLFRKHLKSLGVGITICPLCITRGNLFKLRTHPTVRFIQEEYRIIPSNEYTGFWRARGLSYDWYLLYVFMSGRAADLSFLKQMAINSLIYNGLSEFDNNMALSLWNELWDRFVMEIHQSTPVINTTTHSKAPIK